jgi:hypothetical protein
MHDRVLRLRPVVQRRFPNGKWLVSLDDDWRVDAREAPADAVVRLHNQQTGHFVDMYADSVEEYREPGFLVLREQLTLVGRAIDREPLADRRLAYASAKRLPKQPRTTDVRKP